MNNTVLLVNSSGRYQDSLTRQVSDKLVEELLENLGVDKLSENLIERDLAKGLPFIDEAWIGANFTPAENRNEQQQKVLDFSDELVEELKTADTLVIAAPMYNFSIPAVLKAWIDLIARAKVTFQYTETGPEGLLKNKKAYLVVASGGVPLGSEADFSTNYLRQVLGFVGITDVTLIDATKVDSEQQLIEQIKAA